MFGASGQVMATARITKRAAAAGTLKSRAMVAIRFTGNYEDLSTDRGYQFKFYCEKCQNGYMSSFKASTIGTLGAAARVAGNLFGGIFGSVADSSYEVQRAVGGGAHDSALKDAVEEIAP